MAEWTTGDRTFAYWEGDGYWYPATITAIDGEDITVRWDEDDSEEVVAADCLDGYSVVVGETGAESWSTDDDEYYPVTVNDVQGESIQVEYEDATIEWVDITNLRFADEG